MTLVAAAAVALASLGATGANPAASASPKRTADAVAELLRQKQWAAAESLANVQLTRLAGDPTPDSLAVADALFAIGWARLGRVELTDGAALRAASRCLQLRTRLGADPLEVARAHDLMGRVLDFTGRSDTALVHLRRVVELRTAQLGPVDTLVANAWYRLAMVHRNLFDLAPALDEFGHALRSASARTGPSTRR